MKLNEQIDRIHEMMGINESEVPNSIKRRISQTQQILNVVLDNSYPTDFDSAEHFTQGIMKEVFDYMLEEEQVETAVSMLEFIKEYFEDDIKNYYNERMGMVEEEHQRIQENKNNKFINAIDKYGLYRFLKSTKMSPEDLFNNVSEDYLTSKYKINLIKDFIKDNGNIFVTNYSNPIIYKETKDAFYEIVYLSETKVYIYIIDKANAEMIGDLIKNYNTLDDSGLDKVFNFCLKIINDGK